MNLRVKFGIFKFNYMASLLPKIIGCYINILSYAAPKKAFSLAYKLFSNPRLGRLDSKNLPSILQTAKRETITNDGHHFETYLWSQGETELGEGEETIILLVHGWESNASRWEKLVSHLLKTKHTILAVDAPAHGLSGGSEFNVPLYASFIDVVVKRFNPKHIVGHSMGGIAAAYYQHQYPGHNLQKMVLLGAPSDFSIILENYIKLLSLNQKIWQALVDYTKTHFKINVHEFTGQRFLKNTKLPGIIAHDTTDTVVLYSEAQKLAASWQHAEFITTTGYGHSLHDDELYQKITAFLVEA